MLYLPICGCICIAWTLLSLLGRERNRRLQIMQAHAQLAAKREKERHDRTREVLVVK